MTLSLCGDLQRLVCRADPIPDLKRQLATELAPLVAHWRRADVAVLIGTEPARVSDLRSGNVDRFSLETLIRYLSRLRHDVELRVVKRMRREAPPQLIGRASARSAKQRSWVSSRRGHPAPVHRPQAQAERRLD